MKDGYGRDITYMRISVTDRCNLRCAYCMPEEGVYKKQHAGMLTFEEIERIVAAAASLGIYKFRITGGEPLVKKGVTELVGKLSAIKGVRELVMTTNGTLLSPHAAALKKAGLSRVNISIDSVFEEKYRRITRGGCVYDALDGIRAAERAGLSPKLNIVLMKGFNDDEIFNFAQFTINDTIDVRFIELMAVGADQRCPYEFMPVSEAKAKFPALTPCDDHVDGCGPAEYYRMPEAKGRIGFISPISKHFCGDCNKIRLTPDGKIKTCLHSETEIDIREALRTGSERDVQDALTAAISQKEERHLLSEGVPPVRRNMNSIGG